MDHAGVVEQQGQARQRSGRPLAVSQGRGPLADVGPGRGPNRGGEVEGCGLADRGLAPEVEDAAAPPAELPKPGDVYEVPGRKETRRFVVSHTGDGVVTYADLEDECQVGERSWQSWVRDTGAVRIDGEGARVKELESDISHAVANAKKYAPDNWKYVPNADARYMDAAFRHMAQYMQGDKYDGETGNNHLAHAVCCLLFKLWFDRQQELNEFYAPF